MSIRRLGNYQIIEYLGGGGFGSVFKAEDVSKPGRIVAIKELHKKHTRNASIKQRFFQEAVAMARLDHPNLPRLFTFGEDSGCYYLVMEFLAGKLLSDEIRERGSIPAPMAVPIAVQVLEALGYAHKSGIIHRDLKPDNIMLIQDAPGLKVKVLDFGIARMIGGENLTVTGEGFGTPAYMSPERITGAMGNDPRIDIYSVGIILYEMLSGKAPFESTASDPAIYWMEMRTQHECDPLPSLVPLGVPVDLDQVVQRAAAKRLEDRYPSPEDLVVDLKVRGLIEGVPASALPHARLSLTVQPGGSEVYVDDTFRGSADTRGKILIEGIKAGLHNVRVSKDGFNDYRISVALEEGRQTDLQVALAARSTVPAAPAAPTLVGGFETSKLQGGDEVKTALLVIESLPAGTTIFVGDKPVGLAGEDGRATIQLVPGDHDIRVAAPTGESAQRHVTLANSDTGSQQVLTLPLGRPTKPPPSTAIAVAPSTSSSGMRRAAVGVVILLLALAASAVYILVFQRGRTMVGQQSENPGGQPVQSLQAASTEASTPNQDTPAAQDATAADKQAQDLKKELQESEAEKEKLAKKLAEDEKKRVDEPSGAETKSVVPPPAVEPTPPSATQAQTQTSQPASSPGGACMMVTVTGPGGQPGSQLRVLINEQTDSGRSMLINGRTNQNGVFRQCGFTPNHEVKIAVFGPRGMLLGTKSTTLAAGRNFVEVTVVPPRSTSPDELRRPLRNRRKLPGIP
jgi:hypothetical protein